MWEILELILVAISIVKFIFFVFDRVDAHIRGIIQEELQKKNPSCAGKQSDGCCSKCKHNLEQ